MELTQCRYQGGTLEDFYKKSPLLRVVSGLRSLPVPYRAWGLSYPDMLCLLASDDLSSPRYVKIQRSDDGYRVDYLLPKGMTPGETRTWRAGRPPTRWP